MRAVIPAFVLLFIGLVAAIPFRRPPADLLESQSRSIRPTSIDNLVPSAATTVGSTHVLVDTNWTTTTSPAQELQALEVMPLDKSLEAKSLPPVVPTQRYAEIAIPLQKPTLPTFSMAANKREQESRDSSTTGHWRTGLSVAMPPTDEPVGSMVRDPKLQAQPTVLAPGPITEKVSLSIERTVSSPSVPNRIRQFIREPEQRP